MNGPEAPRCGSQALPACALMARLLLGPAATLEETRRASGQRRVRMYAFRIRLQTLPGKVSLLCFRGLVQDHTAPQIGAPRPTGQTWSPWPSAE